MIASTDFSSSVNPARPATGPAARPLGAGAAGQTDHELVHRFNGGDESAFVEIIARYHDKMISVAFSVLHNRSDAEEIAQDTLVRAYRALDRFRGDSSLATWLHQIALNLSRNRYWYNHRRRQHAMRSFDSVLSADSQATLGSLVASEAPNPTQAAVTGEFLALVATCMERLGPCHREILTRRNILNGTYAEIARALGISIGTVKSRIARARKSLRVLLTAACPEFAPDATPQEWFEISRNFGLQEIITA